MTRRSDSIVLAEQQVAEARTAALDEYRAAQAKLRRRMSSPLFIGGVLLAVIAVGYLARGRGRSRQSVEPGSTGTFSAAVKAAKVLLPLWVALNSVTRGSRRADADPSRTAS